MVGKLIRKVVNNFGLKFLALLFALVLWVVVVNIDDPINVQSYTTSVTLVNENYITEQDKYYEVLGGDNTVSFSVSAKRSVQRELSNSDFKATADMEKIEHDEKSGNWRVPVTVSVQKAGNDVRIVSKQLYKEIELVDLGRTQIRIIADTKGMVADNCALGEVQIVGSNLMKISGPASIISRIDKVTATINVEGMSSDVTDSVVPVFFDAEGNVIDTTKLTLNISTVAVAAQILSTKEVALEFLTTGTPASGYVATDVSYSPESVRIKGESTTLNPVNKITIPEEVLDLTGVTASIETTVDISSYLPKGTSLVLNSDASIEVRVTVEPVVTRTLWVPVKNLVIENLGDGFLADYMEENIAVEVSGAKSVIDALNAEKISGTADASGLGGGEHYLAVTLAPGEEEYNVINAPRVFAAIRDTGAPGEEGGGTDSPAAGEESGDAPEGTNGTAGSGSHGTGAGDSTGGTSGSQKPDEDDEEDKETEDDDAGGRGPQPD